MDATSNGKSKRNRKKLNPKEMQKAYEDYERAPISGEQEKNLTLWIGNKIPAEEYAFRKILEKCS